MLISFNTLFQIYAHLNKKIDYKYIKKFTDEFCKINGLKKVNVEIKPGLSKDGYAMYNLLTRTVAIRLQTCYEFIYASIPDINTKEANFNINTVLLHELYHHKQQKIINDWKGNESFSMILADSFKLNYDLYQVYHDIVPSEHNADARAIIDQITNSEQLGVYSHNVDFNRCVLKTLLNGYEFRDGFLYSPNEIFYRILKGDCCSKLIDNISPESLKDRLVEGFPISINEYEQIDSVISGREEILDVDTFLKRI